MTQVKYKYGKIILKYNKYNYSSIFHPCAYLYFKSNVQGTRGEIVFDLFIEVER